MGRYSSVTLRLQPSARPGCLPDLESVFLVVNGHPCGRFAVGKWTGPAADTDKETGKDTRRTKGYFPVLFSPGGAGERPPTYRI